jgi:hypothetical protein
LTYRTSATMAARIAKGIKPMRSFGAMRMRLNSRN